MTSKQEIRETGEGKTGNKHIQYSPKHKYEIAQSAGAVEYTDCFSAEG